MLDRRPLVSALGVALSVLILGACGPRPQTAAELTMPPAGPASLDDLTLVDCLLPGQVRQLGAQLTYLGPRRLVKSTKNDCAIRGGEFVLFDRSDYRTALATLLPKAQAGDPVAQTYVGEIHEKGLGLTAPDYRQAAEWYQRAADQGHAPAQIHLGALYERGLGVPLDKARALDLYRRASGIADDPLIFESRLKAEREAFQRELAVRNRLAAALRAQLQQAKTAPPAPVTKPPAAPAAPKQPVNPGPQTPPIPTPQPQADAVKLPLDANQLERQAKSQLLDAQSEAERIEREIHAIETLKQSDTGKTKAAQLGKLELARREQRQLLVETAQQLSQVQRAGGAL